MTYLLIPDFGGQSWNLNYLYGVQGVASSNPAAPTIRFNKKDQSTDWSFLFSGGGSKECPTNFCSTEMDDVDQDVRSWLALGIFGGSNK